MCEQETPKMETELNCPVLNRGEIYYIENRWSNPVGTELIKSRPAVVVSERNDGGAIVAYLTSKPKSFAPYHVVIHSSGIPSATVLCEQVSYVDARRFGDKLGDVTPDEMTEIERALQSALGIEVDDEKIERLTNECDELKKALRDLEYTCKVYKDILEPK